MPGTVRHLYVHLPFCAHRCGYCDFVTVAGRSGEHGRYVDAVLAELELHRSLLAPQLETVYLGGGTPTFTEPAALERLLLALPHAREVTVEANPETMSPELAHRLAGAGVTRVSLGAQSFDRRALALLERRAGPGDVRRAVALLRDAGFANVSLDLLYGIPGQGHADVERDLAAALALEPDHLSCYELEAKPGTRFTRAHGASLEEQAEELEGHAALVVETLLSAGYRWYETSSFCRDGKRGEHNLAYWRGRDYLGLGIGAVSTVGLARWRNRPSLSRYVGALARGLAPACELESLTPAVRLRERLMLGLRLDEPLDLSSVEGAYDPGALDRLVRLGLVDPTDGWIRLTRRGRLLGGGVTAELLLDEVEPSDSRMVQEIPANRLVSTG